MQLDHFTWLDGAQLDFFSQALAGWIAPAHDSTKAYVSGAYVYNGTTLYRCKEDIAPGEFNASQWEEADITSLLDDLSKQSVVIQNIVGAGTDFNSIQTNSIRHFVKGGTYLNAPFDDNGYLLTAANGAEAGGVGEVMQVAYRMTAEGQTSFETYLRTKNGNAWTSWAKSISETDKSLTKDEYPADAKVVGETFASHDARIKSAADNAAQALNDTDSLKVQMGGASDTIEDMTIRMDTMETGLGAYITNAEVNEDEKKLVFYHNDEELFSVPWGGGGGGGSTTSVQMTSKITTGWISKNSRVGVEVPVTFTWSSLEDGLETGPGYVIIESNFNSQDIAIQQGECTITIPGEWILADKNTIKLSIYDSLGNVRRHSITVWGRQVMVTSSLNVSEPFYGDIEVSYTPIGKDINKVVHFVLDGTEIGTVDAGTASDVGMNYIIPQQPAGVHSLEIYAIGRVGTEQVESDHLYYEIMWLDEYSSRPLIALSHKGGELGQYVPLNMTWRVYTPNKSTTDRVTISINGTVIRVDEDVPTTVRDFNYTFDTPNDPDDENDVTVVSFMADGMIEPKTITFKITPAEVQIQPETDRLELYLDSKNRSNNEVNWDVWEYNGIQAQFSGFNKFYAGWQTDDEGQVMLRLLDDARVYIPYTPFNREFADTGYTISISFKSHNVVNYDAPIISCMSSGKGFSITPNMISFSAGTTLAQRYSDNDFIRVDIVYDYRNYHSMGDSYDADRLLRIFINGVWCRTIRYDTSNSTTQDPAVGISIGSSEAGVDIYTIRCYNKSLTNRQVERNWIADTRDPVLRVQRYNENNIFGTNGKITIATLKKDLPYFVISMDELPTSKDVDLVGDVEFVDQVNESLSFRIKDAILATQGTSSQKYFRKNFSIKAPKNSIYINGSSTGVSEYAMSDHSIPHNAWVLKKDVASVEGKNNVVGVDAYNRFCPYKTPEMIEDSRVRWGIEGRPAVLFWHNTKNDTTEFIGKVNFNLPKRAPAPYGYPPDSEQLANDDIPSREESWEVETNNTANVRFQAANFEGEAWKDDFEARMPNKYYENSKIKYFVEFVASTYRNIDPTVAPTKLKVPEVYTIDSIDVINFYPENERGFTYTGNNPYTVTCTHDTNARRLVRFRAMAPLYMQMNAWCFYYMYVYLLLGTDSYSKNLFIGFHGDEVTDSRVSAVFKRKAVPEPYDMDTILGINNSGFLTYSPFLTDTDRVESNVSGLEADDDGLTAVFQAQDSALMNNIRDAFWGECRTALSNMYENGLTAEELIRMFRAHAKPWSQAVYNADEENTYAYPMFVSVHRANEGQAPAKTEYYLPMLQGDKDSHMSWFIRNRYRFVCSQYTVGPALNTYITFRIYNVAHLKIYYVQNIFGGMKFGEGDTSYTEVVRVKDGAPVNCDYDEGVIPNNFEIRIYSGDYVRKIEGMASTYPNEVDFSMATRIEEILLGSDTPNPNLRDFEAKNCPNLQVLDLRNCRNMGSKIHLEMSRNIRTVDLSGTQCEGVELMEGCKLETLILPATCNIVTLRYLPELETFTIPSWSNVETFMLAGVDNSILDPITALNNLNPGTAINIEDIDMTVSTVSEIDAFYAKIDVMKGVTREFVNNQWDYIRTRIGMSGEREPLPPQVSGVIHIPEIDGADLNRLLTKYPNINIDAAETHSTRYYVSQGYTGEGDPIGQVTCTNGQMDANQNPPATVAANENTVADYNSDQYSYTWIGWSTHPKSEVVDVQNSDVREEFKRDHWFYAAFTKVVRTYTVYYRNPDEEELQKFENVPYGSLPPAYTRDAPTFHNVQTNGWNRSLDEPITGDTTIYATYPNLWTATFVKSSADGGGTLWTHEWLEDGQTPVYGGETPTTTQGSAEDYPFEGWEPALGPIYANTTYTAKFGSPIEIAEKDYTWTQVTDWIEAGTLDKQMKLGNIIPLDLGTEGAVGAQLVALGADDMANGGKATATFIVYHLLATSKRWNPPLTRADGVYTEGTGTIGGYVKSEINKDLNDDILPILKVAIGEDPVAVTKKCTGYDTGGNSSKDYTVSLAIWLPSYREVFQISPTAGEPSYEKVFKTSERKVKMKVGASSATNWWLRSINGLNSVYRIGTTGKYSSNDSVDLLYGVAFGFCLAPYYDAHYKDVTFEQIQEALNNDSLDSLLSLGDIVPLDLGTEGKVDLQLVAWEADDKADGSGKAKATFICYYSLKTSKHWNPAREGESGAYTEGTGTIGGYGMSEIDDYLTGDVWNMLPEALRNMVVEVTKSWPGYNSAGSSQTYSEGRKIWLPSYNEVFSNTSKTGEPSYTGVLSSSARRKKKKAGASSFSTWWLRSATGTNYANNVNSSGSINSSSVTNTIGVAFGLSIDKS